MKKMVLLKDDFRDTALHLSACQGEVAIVKLLLARGADVDAENNLGSTPLNRAAVAGKTEVRTHTYKHAALFAARGSRLAARGGGAMGSAHNQRTNATDGCFLPLAMYKSDSPGTYIPTYIGPPVACWCISRKRELNMEVRCTTVFPGSLVYLVMYCIHVYEEEDDEKAGVLKY